MATRKKRISLSRPLKAEEVPKGFTLLRTLLCNDLGDAQWNGIRQQHFARAITCIRDQQGFLIKNTGDGVLALFHNAGDVLTFSMTLCRDTGHAAVRVRVGVHVGQVGIDSGDTFGRKVNLTARIMAHAKGDGIRVSDQAKHDLD